MRTPGHMHARHEFNEKFKLRPEVLAFALLMEKRLREKDEGKGQTWKGMTQEQLFPPFMVKAFAVEKAIFNDGLPVAGHAVDLANYAMMIATVAGALTTGDADGGEGWAALDQPEEWRCA